MHEYRRFVQQQLDERGWKQSELVRKSGLSRQLVWSILNDSRDHLGQMPDDSTLEGLAKGFDLPTELFRTAAARSLVGYSDDGTALTIQLQEVSIDALLNEVRRRFYDYESRAARAATKSDASSSTNKNEKTRRPRSNNPKAGRATGPLLPPSAAEQARKRRPK